MPGKWRYMKNREIHGPIAQAQLKQLADGGKLLPTDLVREDGMEEWVPAQTIAWLWSPMAAIQPSPRQASARPTVGQSVDVELVPVSSPEKKSSVLLWIGLGVGIILLLVFCCGAIGAAAWFFDWSPSGVR